MAQLTGLSDRWTTMDTLTPPARPNAPQLLLSESADIYPKTAISSVIVYSQDKTDFRTCFILPQT